MATCCSKKLVKAIEAKLNKEVEIKNATRIIQMFKSNSRGIPMELVQHAVKTLYKHSKKRSVQKEKKVAESITKHADVIEENMSALYDLMSDVMWDTTNLLGTMALNDPEKGGEEEVEDEYEDDIEADIDFLSSILQEPKKKATKQPGGKIKKKVALPSAPAGNISSDDEDNPGGGAAAVPAHVLG